MALINMSIWRKFPRTYGTVTVLYRRSKNINALMNIYGLWPLITNIFKIMAQRILLGQTRVLNNREATLKKTV